MHSLLYVSSAAMPFTPDALNELLARARARNAAADITGMLLYKDGNFMQLLEGEESTVRSVYTRIVADPRHTGLLTLLQGAVPARSFGQWSMWFRDLRASGATGVPGYTDMMNTPLTSGKFAADPSRAQKLLLMFREKM